MDEEDSVSEDDASPAKRRRHPIKSGRLCTSDSHVLHRVKWPHEMIVCSQGKAPVYEDISLALFSNRYLAVVSEEGPTIHGHMLVHVREMFENVEMYGWRVVREYHTAWLQLLEPGQAAWSDERKRAQLCRLMV